MNLKFPACLLLAFGAACFSVACASEDDKANDDSTGGSGGTAGAAGRDAGGDGSGAEAPVYVVGTRIFSPDGSDVTSYFHVVSSIDADAEVDPSRALEEPGAAKLMSIGNDWFAVGAREAPTITEYTVEDGEFVKGDSISLDHKGVVSLWETFYVVSDTKAYYVDRANSQLVIVNPADMTVGDVVAMPETAREGYLSLYGYHAIERGDRILFTVGWFDWNTNDTILEETGLVVLNTETDEVERFDVDTRCGGITTPLTVESGDTYLVSSALAAAAYRLERIESEPCALRINAGQDAIDPDYALKLGELTDGALAGEPLPAGGNELFLRVFEEEGVTINEESYTYDLTGSPTWHWWRWNVETDEMTSIEQLEPSTTDVVWFQVDGKPYGTQAKADYSETTLIDLTAEGGPKKMITVPGFMMGLARLN